MMSAQLHRTSVRGWVKTEAASCVWVLGVHLYVCMCMCVCECMCVCVYVCVYACVCVYPVSVKITSVKRKAEK